jgi:hypothetical protein
MVYSIYSICGRVFVYRVRYDVVPGRSSSTFFSGCALDGQLTTLGGHPPSPFPGASPFPWAPPFPWAASACLCMLRKLCSWSRLAPASCLGADDSNGGRNVRWSEVSFCEERELFQRKLAYSHNLLLILNGKDVDVVHPLQKGRQQLHLVF